MTMPNDNTPSSSASAPKHRPKAPLAPAASFADVLKDFTKLPDLINDAPRSWARQPAPDLSDRRASIIFQKLDIRDNFSPSGVSEIHLFGVTKSGNSILVRVRGFEHYFYYPAPTGFTEDDLGPLRDTLNKLFPEGSPAVSAVDLDNEATRPGARKLSFLKIYLRDHRCLKAVKDIFTQGKCDYKDLFSSPDLTYESQIPYFLRYMLDNEVTACTWLKIPEEKYTVVPSESRLSHCQLEVITLDTALMICDTVDNRQKFGPLRVLSFDIECNIPPKEGEFSNAKQDSVIQIGNMVSIFGEAEPFIRNIFTLGTCSPIEGSDVLSFEDEKEMLLAWRKFFVEVDPDIVIGYNITQFDIPYLLERSQVLKIPEFAFLGRIKGASQCYNFEKGRPGFLGCPGYDGRLILDVFHHIREHHTLKGDGIYKLNGVSSHFLGEKKEDIEYTQIPALQNGDADTRRSLAVYCLKDVYLPLRLFHKLKCFETEVREAKEAHVPFNVMRVWRPLKKTAKEYLDAVRRQYVLSDGAPR